MRKIKPMLFSGPMIRAIKAQRKTQTRRIIKPQPADYSDPLISFAFGRAQYSWRDHRKGNGDLIWFEPRWQRGDIVWVRETFAHVGSVDPQIFITRADYPDCVPRGYENLPADSDIKWCPSIHMLQRDSRITLEIMDHRVERLNDITDQDAIAEGIYYDEERRAWRYDPAACAPSPVAAYAALWDHINGPGSWAKNPWVTVTDFSAQFCNVKEVTDALAQVA